MVDNKISKLKCYCLSEQKEIERTFKLRYEAFIGEKMSGSSGSVLTNTILYDDIDEKAYHFGVYDNDKLIAGARYAISDKSDIAAFRFFPEYSYDFFKNLSGKKTSICIGEPDWVVLKSEYRFSPASLILLFHIIEHMLYNYPVDIFIAMVEEGNLVDFYRKFGFNIITESKREIDAYGNGDLTTSYIAYMSIDEKFFQNTSNSMLNMLLDYNKDYYEERINALRRRIVQIVSFCY